MTEPLLNKNNLDKINEYLTQGNLKMDEEWGDHYYAPVWTAYEKLFLKHKNAAFGEHFERAGRGALFVLVMGIPFIFFGVTSDVYTPTSIVFLLFALFLTTGDTIHFALGGVSGTGLAVLNIWILNGVFPGGYAAEMTDAVWFAGACWGSLSMIMVLWLNFEVNTKIFYLSTFVWYLMDFLDQDSKVVFATGFSIPSLQGQEFKELAVAIFGSCMGVVAAFIPFPVNAKDKAQLLCKNLVMHLQMGKLNIITNFTAKEKDVMSLTLIRTELTRLQEEMVGMAPLIDAAWYECLGIPGKCQRQRVMLQKISAYLSKSIDLLSTLAGACESEGFTGNHNKVMETLKPLINNIVNSNGKVLKICMAGLYHGSFADEGGKFLKAQGEDALLLPKQEVKKLTDEFLKVRSHAISDEQQNNHIFVTTFCLTQEYTRDLFRDLVDSEHFEKEIIWSEMVCSLGGLLDPAVISDTDHISWTVRNAISICLAFFLGHFGYAPFLASNNANISSTCGVLLSKFVGSAMTKNLNRMQGVVLGIVFGNMVYSLLGYCLPQSHIMLAIVLLTASWTGLFLYYHSTTFGTVGLLLTVFGIKAMLQPCKDEPSADAAASYSQIVTCTVAIFIMTIVDTCLMPARASDMAIHSMNKAFDQILSSLQRIMDNEEMVVHSREGHLGIIITNAKGLGVEASLEPRYWREDWPVTLFNTAMATLMHLRHNIRTIEENVLDTREEEAERKGDRVKNEDFREVLNLDALQKSYTGLRSIMLSHLCAVKREVNWALDDKVKHDVFVKRKELKIIGARETALLWPAALKKFSEEITELMKKREDKEDNEERRKSGVVTEVTSMTEDKIADAAILVKSLGSMLSSLDTLLSASSSVC